MGAIIVFFSALGGIGFIILISIIRYKMLKIRNFVYDIHDMMLDNYRLISDNHVEIGGTSFSESVSIFNERKEVSLGSPRYIIKLNRKELDLLMSIVHKDNKNKAFKKRKEEKEREFKLKYMSLQELKKEKL